MQICQYLPHQHNLMAVENKFVKNCMSFIILSRLVSAQLTYHTFSSNQTKLFQKLHLGNVFSKILWVTRGRNVFFFLKGYFLAFLKRYIAFFLTAEKLIFKITMIIFLIFELSRKELMDLCELNLKVGHNFHHYCPVESLSYFYILFGQFSCECNLKCKHCVPYQS